MYYFSSLLCLCIPVAALQNGVAHDAIEEKPKIHARHKLKSAESKWVSLAEQTDTKATASKTGAEASDSKTGDDAEEEVARHAHKRHRHHHHHHHHGNHSHRHNHSHREAHHRAAAETHEAPAAEAPAAEAYVAPPAAAHDPAAEEPQYEIELLTEDDAAGQVNAVQVVATELHSRSHHEANVTRHRHQAVYEQLLLKSSSKLSKVPREYHPFLLQRLLKKPAVTKLLEHTPDELLERAIHQQIEYEYKLQQSELSEQRKHQVPPPVLLAAVAPHMDLFDVRSSEHLTHDVSLSSFSTKNMNKNKKKSGAHDKAKRTGIKLNHVHIPGTLAVAAEVAGYTAGAISAAIPAEKSHEKVLMKDKNECSKMQAPLEYVPEIMENSSRESKEFLAYKNFCVTKHPYERAIALYNEMLADKYGGDQNGTGRCSWPSLNEYIQGEFKKVLDGDRFINDCHFLPQHRFVWGGSGRQFCNNIIRHDQLPWAFNELMQRNNFDFRMSKEHMNSNVLCPALKVQAINLANKRIIDLIWKDDFKRLGYTKRTKDVAFVHIPRNAGLTIRKAGGAWLTTLAQGWPNNMPMSKQAAQGSCQRFLLPPRHMLPADKELMTSRETFCVVRHPYDRALSLYTLMLSAPNGVEASELNGIDLFKKAPCSKWGFNSFVLQALKVYQAYNGRIPVLGINTTAPKADTLMLNCQMVPQSDYVWDENGNQTCDHVLRHDNLDKAFKKFMRNQGLNDYVHLVQDKLGRKSAWRCPHLNSRKHLYDETKKRIQEIYSADFEKFNYAP